MGAGRNRPHKDNDMDYLQIAFLTAWEHGDKPHGKTRRALQDWLLKDDRNGCYHDLDTARELGGWVASDADILVSVVRATSGDALASLLSDTLPDDRASANRAIEALLMELASDIFGGNEDVLPYDWATACDAACYVFDEEAIEILDGLTCIAGTPCRDQFITLVCRTISGAIASARNLHR